MEHYLEKGDIFFLPQTIKSVTAHLPRYFSTSKNPKFSEEVKERMILLDQKYEFDPLKLTDDAIAKAIGVLRETLPLSVNDETLIEEIINSVSQYLPFTDVKIFDPNDLLWFYEVTEVWERNPPMIVMHGMSDRNIKRMWIEKNDREIESTNDEPKEIIDTTQFPATKYVEIGKQLPHPSSKKQVSLFDRSMLQPHHLVIARRLSTDEVPTELFQKVGNLQDPNPDCIVQHIKFYQKGRTLGRISPEQVEVYQTSK